MQYTFGVQIVSCVDTLGPGHLLCRYLGPVGYVPLVNESLFFLSKGAARPMRAAMCMAVSLAIKNGYNKHRSKSSSSSSSGGSSSSSSNSSSSSSNSSSSSSSSSSSKVHKRFQTSSSGQSWLGVNKTDSLLCSCNLRGCHQTQLKNPAQNSKKCACASQGSW